MTIAPLQTGSEACSSLATPTKSEPACELSDSQRSWENTIIYHGAATDEAVQREHSTAPSLLKFDLSCATVLLDKDLLKQIQYSGFNSDQQSFQKPESRMPCLREETIRCRKSAADSRLPGSSGASPTDSQCTALSHGEPGSGPHQCGAAPAHPPAVPPAAVVDSDASAVAAVRETAPALPYGCRFCRRLSATFVDAFFHGPFHPPDCPRYAPVFTPARCPPPPIAPCPSLPPRKSPPPALPRRC